MIAPWIVANNMQATIVRVDLTHLCNGIAYIHKMHIVLICTCHVIVRANG